VHPGGPLAAAISSHALATGLGRGLLAAAGIALLTLAINIAVIRIRRADLTGAQPRPDDPPRTTARRGARAGAASINAQPAGGKPPGIASHVAAPPHRARADPGPHCQATPNPGGP